MTSEELEKERLLIESERRRVPHLFERSPLIDDAETLKWIGIDANIFGERPLGYIKLYPQDFIVEEIGLDKSLSTIEIEPLIKDVSIDGLTYYADLVKIGISTLEAKYFLSKSLGIENQSIGYAGIKDKIALTSQGISIRRIDNLKTLEDLNSDSFFLKNIRKGKGIIKIGDLNGNLFTIIIRFQDDLSVNQIKKIEERLQDVEKSGFWNFFYMQRFGTPRLISHILGLLIFKNEYEKAIKTEVVFPAKRESLYFQNIRREVEDIWGDWPAIKEKLAKFPSIFVSELEIVNYLSEHPNDFSGALKIIPDQIKLWIYAFSAYLFNLKLSELINSGDIPFLLPLITSFKKKDWELYKESIDGYIINSPSKVLDDFIFIKPTSQFFPTFQKVRIHSVKFEEKIMALSFSLPKGSYATSFITNFITIASDLPILTGITKKVIDAKKILNIGSINGVLKRFEKIIERRKVDISEN